jgi:hypothetical protein
MWYNASLEGTQQNTAADFLCQNSQEIILFHFKWLLLFQTQVFRSITFIPNPSSWITQPDLSVSGSTHSSPPIWDLGERKRPRYSLTLSLPSAFQFSLDSPLWSISIGQVADSFGLSKPFHLRRSTRIYYRPAPPKFQRPNFLL